MAEEKSQNLEKKVVSGMFWKFLEQISYQGIQLLFSIVLLRLLTKEDVGAVGIISIFISIANSLIQTGFSQALMQKKEIKTKVKVAKKSIKYLKRCAEALQKLSKGVDVEVQYLLLPDSESTNR